ncbi:MAG: NUDIX hydrolase [Coriobacteriia bacterium]|nr:NUDIX hydrolase [Coriobacteriia bacterium]
MAAPAPSGPRIRVAAAILIDDRLVLVRHRAARASYHLLPGGGVGYRETLEDALVREVEEETGLAVTLGEPLLISDTIDPSGPRHVVNITFSATVVGGAITDRPSDAQVEAVELVRLDALTGLDLRPPIAGQLRAMLSGQSVEPTRYLGSLFTTGS